MSQTLDKLHVQQLANNIEKIPTQFKAGFNYTLDVAWMKWRVQGKWNLQDSIEESDKTQTTNKDQT